MNELDKHLLNDFQRDFPLTARPYAAMAEHLGTTEDEVIGTLAQLKEAGMVSRVGAVFAPRRVGVSTLAAMAVPVERLEAVAEMVNSYAEVNHNYEREHRFNLWFVITAPDQTHLDAVIRDIETWTDLPVMSLPLLTDYHIDLGFRLQFS